MQKKGQEKQQEQQKQQYAYELKIPKERVAVLIGKEGRIKKALEENTNTKIKISKEGDITILGSDALGLFNAKEVIRAVGRGFNPETAMLLLKGDHILEIVDMAVYAKTKNAMVRLRGRVIGKEGKSKRNIERLTGTNIAVYGKTIAIIGPPEETISARRAIENILKGRKHASVYRWLEKKARAARLKWLGKEQ